MTNSSASSDRLLALGLLFLQPGLSQATEQTGKLRGTVVNPEGEALEGVVVRVTSPALQGVRSSKTGDSGKFYIPALPPGFYEVRAELDGYRAWAKKELRISMGTSVTLDRILATAGVSESVTIVDDRPVIDRQSTSGAVVTREQIQALPISRSYQGATKTPRATGGSNPNAQGGSSRENKWLLDGANTTDPVTGTFSFSNLDAIEEIEVITGAFRAETAARWARSSTCGLVRAQPTERRAQRLLQQRELVAEARCLLHPGWPRHREQ